MKIFRSQAMMLALLAGLWTAAGTFTAAAGSVVLSDTTFGNLTTVVSRPCSPQPCTPPVGYGPNGLVTITTGVTSGNVDSIKADNYAINASFNWSSSSMLSAGLGVLDNALTYDPSGQGAIVSLDLSLNKMLTIGNPNANPARVILEQNGVYYRFVTGNSPGGTIAGQYTNYTSTGLTAASFDEICLVSCGPGNFGNVDITVHPDFSSSGSAIVFGVLFNSPYNPTAYTAFYDNLEFDITNVSSTPLPAALPMFAAGAGVIGLVARRKKKKSQAIAA